MSLPSLPSRPGYPPPRTVDQVEDYFGTAVADEYRWLEDQTSSEVGDWVRAQAEAAERYLASLPGRDRLGARLAPPTPLPSSPPPPAALTTLPTPPPPVPHGGRWFRLTNDGTQQQSVLRMSDEPMGTG